VDSPDPAPGPGKLTGSLLVRTEPSKVKIWIDGGFEGRSPVQIDDMIPGLVQVRAAKKGVPDQEEKVRIRAGRRSELTLILAEPEPTTGRLSVSTEPADARIRILNIVPRYKPGMELKPGSYILEVSAYGYQTDTRTVNLKAGEELQVDFALEEVQAANTQPTAQRTGKTWTEPVTGMEFVYVKGGCYQMGSTQGGSDEKPVHKVCVDGFWLGKYEVTQGEWEKIMGDNPSYFAYGSRYPVENVSWNDTRKFIKKLNQGFNREFRLPTEAEWEYAARAGTTTPFAFGSCISTDQANYSGNYDYNNCGTKTGVYREKTWQVGSGAANNWGLYDMHGNVWEWCSDWYDKDYYSSSPGKNPQGAASGSHRVLRGGSWIFNPANVRSANRYWYKPSYRVSIIGFRLAFVEGSR
jgi:formylglycine-generating enzyme required for sulfatase activity